MADADPAPCIYVLAGTNGAGKSSIGGAMFRQAGAEYFNPDEAAGRLNLIRLLPKLTELRMYDNSAEFDPDTGHAPDPQLVLHMERGTIVNPRDLLLTPEWAKPIVAAALRLATR